VIAVLLVKFWYYVYIFGAGEKDTTELVCRVNDPVIVIGIRFLNYALHFMYVISDSNILFSHGSFIFDVS